MAGRIYRISGPVIVADGMADAKMHDLVRVGELGLFGEVVMLDGDRATVQVYEDTAGLKPGEKVVGTGRPLSVLLAPGLMGSIFDGLQRPLDRLLAAGDEIISRGAGVERLDTGKRWHFVPIVGKGAKVGEGQAVGEVKETGMVSHRIMVPRGVRGQVADIKEGDFTIEDTVATLSNGGSKTEVKMAQEWPVRMPRPVSRKIQPAEPLITGQRVIDTFFPVAKGGTAAIPGGFGTGKTVMQHSLAKWSNSDIIVYIGCGERGNEMTDMVKSFPKLVDPRRGRPIMERTVMIANVSNMPVAAREASIYTGMTIAEYYRDMGYDVALMADSTSRWAEALREISGRLEELPGEDGYPSYLGNRIAEFYERAGRAELVGGGTGSITAIGAVSPAGGDVSEPVSQNTLRFTRVFWALDAALANARHYPAINWLSSYSLYLDGMDEWYRNSVGDGWVGMRVEAMRALEEEAEINEIAQLVGYDALPEAKKLALDYGRQIREDYLQQNALDAVDGFASLQKQKAMLGLLLALHRGEQEAISRGVSTEQLAGNEARQKMAALKEVPEQGLRRAEDAAMKAIAEISKIEPQGATYAKARKAGAGT